MKSQIINSRVPKSRLPACRQQRVGYDRLVDADYVVNAKQLERLIESKQHLIGRSAFVPLRRWQEEILQYDLSL